MTVERPSPWFLLPVLSAFWLFALAHRDVAFAVLCALAVLGAYRHRLTSGWPTRARWWVAISTVLVAWVLCAAYYWTVLQGGTHLTYYRRVIDVYKPWLVTTSAMLCALAVVWAWHLPGEARRRTRFILLCLGFLVVMTGNILSLPPWYLPALGLFCATTMLALVAGAGGFQHHRGRPWKECLGHAAVVVGVLVAIGVGTYAMSAALRFLEAGITAVLAEFMQGSSYNDVIGAGSSITIERHRRVVLSQKVIATVTGKTPPGYLRTQVMTDYQARRWKADRMTAESVAALVERREGNRVRFDLPQGYRDEPPAAGHAGTAAHAEARADGLSTPASQHTLALFTNLRGAVPLPYTARHVTTSVAVSCAVREGGVLYCDAPEGLRYDVASHPAAVRLPYGTGAAHTAEAGTAVQRARQAPEPVLVPLGGLARLLVGDYAAHPLEAAQLLQDYFRRHYTYALTVDLAEQGDPIVDFVLNRRPAYCEYYASGLALMLRALDIPARVVGGFVVREYNPLAGQWIVRQSHAHAWTEVFDAQSGQWVAFDATPPSVTAGLPAGGTLALWTLGWTWVALHVMTLVTWIQVTDLPTWLASLGQAGVDSLHHPAGLLVAGLGVGLVAGLKRRRLIKGWLAMLWQGLLAMLWQDLLAGRQSDGTSLNAVEARRLFQRLALALETRGLPIGAAETLQEYLCRVGQHGSVRRHGAPWLRELTEFVRVYTDVRFCPCAGTTDAAAADVVQGQLSTLRALTEQVIAALQRWQPRY